MFSQGEKEFLFSVNCPSLNQQGQMFLLSEMVPSRFATPRGVRCTKTTSNNIMPVEWHFKIANEDIKEVVN